MLLDNIDCDHQPLDNSEDTDVCELLGGCAPACTATRPCPRMVCIPQGIQVETAQAFDLFGVMRTAEEQAAGWGFHLLRSATANMATRDSARLQRRMLCLIRWLEENRELLKARR